MKKAIKSCSFTTVTDLELSAANLDVAGDDTTWDGEAGACCTRAGGPPIWHGSLEVVEDHLMPAGRNRRRHPRRERSPFDHGEQRRSRRREEAPKRSTNALLLQIQPPIDLSTKSPTFLITLTRERGINEAPIVDARSAQNIGLIDGDIRSSSPHHIRLHPLELRGEEKDDETALDPAGRIPHLSPGITPKTGIAPKTSMKPSNTIPTYT